MADVCRIDRFRGCMLGLALGDALGAPFEGIDKAQLIHFEELSFHVHLPPGVEI